MGTKRKKKDREVNMDINIHETHFLFLLLTLRSWASLWLSW